MRFELSNLLSIENLELIFPHSILKPPVIVLLDPLHILGPRCYFQSRNGFPWKPALTRVGFPHAIGGLRASSKDASLDWIELEGTMDDASVPSRRGNRYVLFLFQDCDSSFFLVSYPVRDGGSKDSATNDYNIPRFHAGRLFSHETRLLYRNFVLRVWLFLARRRFFGLP